MTQPTPLDAAVIRDPNANPRVLFNVYFDLPNLVIQPRTSFKDPYDPPSSQSPWEFSFEDKATMGKTIQQLQQLYHDQSDIMFLQVEFLGRTERDGSTSLFRPHVFVVKHVTALLNTDHTSKDAILLALVYKVTAQMEMMLRQTIWRQADPGIHRATLLDSTGKKLAYSLASEFLPFPLS